MKNEYLFYCELCVVTTPSQYLTAHLKTKGHRERRVTGITHPLNDDQRVEIHAKFFPRFIRPWNSFENRVTYIYEHYGVFPVENNNGIQMQEEINDALEAGESERIAKMKLIRTNQCLLERLLKQEGFYDILDYLRHATYDITTDYIVKRYIKLEALKKETNYDEQAEAAEAQATLAQKISDL